MAQDQLSEVQRLFDELADVEPAAREAYFRQAALDGETAAEVTALLAAADRAGDFLGALSTSRFFDDAALIAGRYRVARPLGRGAMGEVYLAYDTRLNRYVALKFLTPAIVNRSDVAARCIAEARAAAGLDHPHVATVYDIGEAEDGRLFLAMAYYPGESLRERLSRGNVTVADACRIASQIAAALSAAHNVGLVHRDVKPANILFDTSGSAKLADFGVATLAGHGPTTRGAIVGTLAYASPEQVRGEAVDARSDLWALGVVLYEMLAGRRPFAGDNPAVLLYGILHDDPPAFPTGREISETACAIVTALLQKEVTGRPPSADAVARELEHSADLRHSGVRSALTSDVRPLRPPSERDELRGGSLPAMLTTFIGRERELRVAQSLLTSARLLTCTGPGGTGKTRFAIELAARVRDGFADGLWFVSLAEVSDASLVASSVGQALGLRDLSGTPAPARIAALVRDRQILLVLDNFEHVLGATTFVADILAACPRLVIVTTSRTPLGIQGEQELSIPPLATAVSTDLNAQETEAVRLFAQRARNVRPEFTLDAANLAAVNAICTRLDGLPLAIEMAAAWTGVLSPSALLGRLGHSLDLLRSEATDRADRHHTMRNVVSWSYALLTERERAFLDRLTVFSGGLSLDAAAAVGRRLTETTPNEEPASATAAIPDTSEVLVILASLCRRSLLRQEEQTDGEPRFFMLEVVRQFGLERLEGVQQESAARRAHRAYFVALAERASPQLRGPAQGEWFDRLEREYANCRAVLETSLPGEPQLQRCPDSVVTDAARLVTALHRLWLTRGPLLEGVTYVRRAIAAREQSAAVAPGLHAQLLADAGVLALARSLYVEARGYFQRALALQRELGDHAGVATVLNHLGWTTWVSGDLAAGEQMSNEAMSLHREAGNDFGIALSLNNLAWIAMLRGAYLRADKYFAEGLARHRRRGDQRSVGFSLGWMGVLALRRGDPARAEALHAEALTMLEPVADHGYRHLTLAHIGAARHAAYEPGDHVATIAGTCPLLRAEGRLWPLASALTDLGQVLRDGGELERARSALEEALALRHEMGSRAGLADVQVLLATVLHQRGEHDQGRALLAGALRDALDYGSIPTVIDAIEAAAVFGWEEGVHEMATLLQAAADQLRTDLAIPPSPRYEAARARAWHARAHALGARFADTRAAGIALSLDGAATSALQLLEPR